MSVLTIGNFDGCHLGHQALIRETLRLSQTYQSHEPIALTFSPRPEAFFKGIKHESLLTTWDQKLRAFAELGLSTCHRLNFDSAMSAMSAAEFFETVLRQSFDCRHLVVGEDFRFGKGREGSVEWLKKQVTPGVFDLTPVPTKSFGSEKIGSSLLRRLLSEGGNAAEAARMLGRPYLLEGTVVKGQQLGRTIGFPTINLQAGDQLIPQAGVYAGFLWLDLSPNGPKHPQVLARDPKAQPAVFNLGFRPTVTPGVATKMSIEGHLLNPPELALPKGESYGLQAGFYFVARLRNEQKFESLQALQNQIAKDCEAARRLV